MQLIKSIDIILRTLHVINSMAAGGAEKLVSNLASAQSQKHPTGIFTFVNTNEVFFEQLSPEVKTYRAKEGKYFSFTNMLRLYRAMKAYDLIHVHLFPAFYLAGIMSLLFRSKTFVYTEHSTHNKRRSKKFYFIEKFIYNRYSRIICISKSVESKLKAWMGPQTPTVVIENFFDLEEIQQQESLTKERLGFSASDRLLVMVGSFRDDHTKDQMTLIKALQHLPGHYKLLLLGQGVLKQPTEDFVLAQKLYHRVKFLGFRQDVYSVLKACDVGVLSSNWEGFGIALIEYMACGLLAFGTNVEGLRELIISPKTTFQVGDDQGLAQKIMDLDNNAEEQQDLIKKQFEFIKRFSLEQSVNEHQAVYEGVLKMEHR